MTDDIARIRQKLSLTAPEPANALRRLLSSGRPRPTRRSASEIAQWEAAHRCALPKEYRMFLMEIGEGAHYPFGEMLPLTSWWHHLTGESSDQASLPWLQAEFDLPDHFESDSDWGTWLENWESEHPKGASPWTGTMALTDEGCGMMSLLVVRGPSVGRVCFLDFPKPPRMFPQPHVLAWYEAALDASRSGPVGDAGR